MPDTKQANDVPFLVSEEKSQWFHFHVEWYVQARLVFVFGEKDNMQRPSEIFIALLGSIAPLAFIVESTICFSLGNITEEKCLALSYLRQFITIIAL